MGQTIPNIGELICRIKDSQATSPERLKNLNDSPTGRWGVETKWSGVSCSRKNCEEKAWTQAYILIQVQHFDNQCLHSCKTLDFLYSRSIHQTRKRLIKDIFDVECFMEWYSSRIMYRTSGVSKTSSILITHGWKKKINTIILGSVRGRNGAYITIKMLKFKGFKLKSSNEKIIITWWSFFSISTSSLIAACLGCNK